MKKMKITSRFGVFNTMYHNGSYLLLFIEENLKILKFHVNNSFYFEISVSLFYAPPFNKRRALNL